MDALIYLIIIMGLFIGSFLNVCIYRIPEKQSICFPRSHCMKCGHVLGALELIPVISYLALGRRCKQCKEPISSRYMGIEIVTGLGFGVIYYVYRYSLETLLYSTFFCFALVLTMIDWDHMILPTRVIRWGLGLGLIERILQSIVSNNKYFLGYGDVRLMGFLGLFVGFNQLFLMIIISCILASVFGLVLLKVRKSSEPYPLGPFLNGGALIVILWGERLLQSYLSLFNL